MIPSDSARYTITDNPHLLVLIIFSYSPPPLLLRAIEPTSALKLARGKWDLQEVFANDGISLEREFYTSLG